MKIPEGSESRNILTRGGLRITRQLAPTALKSFRFDFYIGCAASIILVILTGAVSYNTLIQQERNEKRIERTYQVLRKTDSLNMLFNQAMVYQTYSKPLAPKDSSGLNTQQYEGLNTKVNSLKALVIDDNQLTQVINLKHQIDTLRRTTFSERSNLRLKIEKINETIHRFKHLEEMSLSSQEAGYKLSSKQTRVVIVAGSVLIMVIVSFLVYLILKELNARIRAYREEFELNQLKSTFVTLASHEFRTPLSSILLSATLIAKYLEKDEKTSIVKHVAKIKQVVHNLEDILEDFLSVERLEEGLTEAEFSSFDLVPLCEEIMAAMKQMARPGQELTYKPVQENAVVCLDRMLISKSINSLLSNAIKYAGDETNIELVTNLTAENLLISVRDNGIGIAKQDQMQLFSKFYRINNTGHISGTGLGLNIVKRYVQLMNGTLQFWSTPYKETCFTMIFPVK
ncbi:HAMP domain-containing sensor histidine kinase [Mucilaginibacter gossypii]|uniref:sensor histidine kinase n=1 Tax=Mucilaginibacter gossypii TaxID=551996 RepID=UPI000DCBE7B2|nr:MULTISPECIES: HAMP domain-containing sensor histidine kinase [Mucilaginibacter]QTE38890.1 HAMP domain-containing sensor histidine kinase [Mucilaginibacter gossypii]RAV55036.1 hypothetical protein DIU36_17660 [Mucilaginibacter rubeus]